MIGFIAGFGLPKTELLDNLQIKEYKDFSIAYSPLNKFQNDKLFFEDENKIVLLDGVIFNKKELIEKYNNENWQDVFNILYDNSNTGFMNDLRGSFCGVVYRKSDDKIFAFTNHSGEKTVYYYVKGGVTIVASHNNLTTDVLRKKGIAYEPNMQCCYELLITGCSLHGNTPFKDIRRLVGGKSVITDGKSCSEEWYHIFKNLPEYDWTIDECVDKYNELFRQAIKRICSKNEEYGYRHEFDLSGGIDSRMTTWVANDMGYKNALNVCFCQSGNIDNTTSRKIAKDIGNDYFFYPLDGGDFIKDIDESVDKYGGQVEFCISTGANRAFKEIDTSDIGLCVTGVGGEQPNAHRTEGNTHTPPRYLDYRMSKFLKLDIPISYSDDYENFEQMNLYEHSMVHPLMSFLIRQDRCEVTTPFYDKDLLDFAFKVPLKYRKDHVFTYTWMAKYYPQATKYVWQSIRMPLDKYFNNKIYLPKEYDNFRRVAVKAINKACRMLKIRRQITLKTDMNPFPSWYISNKDFSNFINNYYADNIHLIKDEKFLNDMTEMFNKGNAKDKLSVINILGVFKKYFNYE